MKTVLIILATFAFDWMLGTIVSYNKKKQLKRDEDLFTFKLDQILKNTVISQQERISRAKELCRNTPGKMTSGAYCVLDSIIIS